MVGKIDLEGGVSLNQKQKLFLFSWKIVFMKILSKKHPTPY